MASETTGSGQRRINLPFGCPPYGHAPALTVIVTVTMFVGLGLSGCGGASGDGRVLAPQHVARTTPDPETTQARQLGKRACHDLVKSLHAGTTRAAILNGGALYETRARQESASAADLDPTWVTLKADIETHVVQGRAFDHWIHIYGPGNQHALDLLRQSEHALSAARHDCARL